MKYFKIKDTADIVKPNSTVLLKQQPKDLKLTEKDSRLDEIKQKDPTTQVKRSKILKLEKILDLKYFLI